MNFDLEQWSIFPLGYLVVFTLYVVLRKMEKTLNAFHGSNRKHKYCPHVEVECVRCRRRMTKSVRRHYHNKVR